MKPVIVLCLVVVCYVRKSHGTFAEFMTRLPSQVGHAFSVAWTSVTDAIKRPVKIKRLGPGGRRRHARFSTTTSTTTEFVLTVPPTPKSRSKDHLLIPMIPKPIFKSIEDWSSMQRPQFLDRVRDEDPASYEAPDVTPMKTKLDDNSFFGHFVFI